MNRERFWSVVVRVYAALGLLLSPMLAFGSWFVARSWFELCFALAQLLMVIPLWRLFLFRRWAGIVVCVVGWGEFLYTVVNWSDFDYLPARVIVTGMALIPTLALTLGKRLWHDAF